MQIAKQIRDTILEGKLNIGDKLPAERTLAQNFGTSRASIREALSALEMLGIVECRSGQGNFVKSNGASGTLDHDLLDSLLRGHDPYEIIESRLEIEPALAAMAAKRATMEDKTKLQAMLETLNGISLKVHSGVAEIHDIIEEYMEQDRLFHLAIGRCAHNSVLFMLFSQVNQMMQESHWRGMKMKSILKEESLTNYDREHTAIFRAIWEGREDVAREEMAGHIRYLLDELF